MSKSNAPTVGKYRALFSRYLKPHWRATLLLTILLVVSILLKLVNPIILGLIIDLVAGGNTGDTLMRYALLFLVIALTSEAIGIVQSYISANLGLLTTNRLRADLALHCLTLDMDFHKQRTPGEMIERVDGDVGKLANFFSLFLVELLGNLLLALGILVVLFFIDWRVGLVLSLFMLGIFLAMARLRNVAVPHWEKARQADAELYGLLEERLSGTEDVRANGGVPYVMRRFYQVSRPVLRTWIKASAYGVSSFGILMVIFGLGWVASLAVGAYLNLLGQISLGTVFVIFRYAQLLRNPIEAIQRQLQDLQQAGASVVRIYDLLDMQSRLVDAGQTLLPSGRAYSVQFDQVSFGYQADPSTPDAQPDMVLRQIDLSLPPEAVLGLLGRTGSGKTTLIRLLARLYDPTQGVIRLEGKPLPELSLAGLRQGVGVVTQEIQLFDASLRDNLTLFDPSISDERILQALEMLGLGGWYRGLPQGLEAKIQPNSGAAGAAAGLSAGEAQLLAFVRVFLRDPGLVILDEASSRLDPATERRLEKAIDQLLRGRTAIIIAHRLDTVQRADTIMILDDGRQIEFGTREALIQDASSHYSRLLKTGLQEALV